MYHGERLNSFTHLAGGVATGVSTAALLVAAGRSGNALVTAGCAVYGVSMLAMFAASTAYHSVRGPRKPFLRKLDHIAIFVMIAGTYAPFCLGPLRSGLGPALLAAVWALAALGALLEFTVAGRTRAPSLLLYFAMSFLATATFPGLGRALQAPALLWIKGGFALYAAGFVFYALDKKFRGRHLHGIWHLFVIAGAICHYVCIYAYVV